LEKNEGVEKTWGQEPQGERLDDKEAYDVNCRASMGRKRPKRGAET